MPHIFAAHNPYDQHYFSTRLVNMLSYLLLSQIPFASSNIITKQSSNSFLRSKRANDGVFEELGTASIERECVEEYCTVEEVNEALPFENIYGVKSGLSKIITPAQAKRWHAHARDQCRQSPKSNRCNKRNTRRCQNKWNDKICLCKRGWEGPLCADDINECLFEEKINECAAKGPNFRCKNVKGGYRCACKDGYSKRKIKNNSDVVEYECRNANECRKNNGGCEHKCVDTEGSYQCSCRTGYVLAEDGHSCIDLDECAEGLDDRCGENTICVNKIGEYYCECKDGFQKHESDIIGFKSTSVVQCFDIDECADNSCGIGL